MLKEEIIIGSTLICKDKISNFHLIMIGAKYIIMDINKYNLIQIKPLEIIGDTIAYRLSPNSICKNFESLNKRIRIAKHFIC